MPESRAQIDRRGFLIGSLAAAAGAMGIGDLIDLAAGWRPYLKPVGLLAPEAEQAEAVTSLLDTAPDGSSVVLLPWSAG
jgi:peptidyl-dipeptidase A